MKKLILFLILIPNICFAQTELDKYLERRMDSLETRAKMVNAIEDAVIDTLNGKAPKGDQLRKIHLQKAIDWCKEEALSKGFKVYAYADKYNGDYSMKEYGEDLVLIGKKKGFFSDSSVTCGTKEIFTGTSNYIGIDVKLRVERSILSRNSITK